MLAFVLSSLCVVGLLRLQTAYASPYTNTDVATAYNMITSGSYPDLVVLDVGNQSEYDSGHIYGAVWIPVWQLEARISELAGHENHEIIVYCLAGGRSATASGILDSHNFTKVYNMLGGISAWQSKGYPVWIATVHNINTTFNYDTIQVAIDANQTLDGHTIQVDSGTYHEHVVVDKSLTLVGENRNTTVIDGDNGGTVIYVKATSNVSITGFTIQRSGCICSGYSGISIKYSHNIDVTNNFIIENGFGIQIYSSHEIIVVRNDIIENAEGVNVGNSSGCVFYHNNFVDSSMYHAVAVGKYTWDDGYPSGGNYWNNYNGTDFHSGSGQNETGSDGIGDEPHEIDSYPPNTDRFPLMAPISFFNVGTWNKTTYYVHIVSNSTLSDFYFSEDDKLIRFNVTRQDGAVGFCRVAIPKIIVQDWWQGNYTVLVNREEPIMMNNWTDGTYTYIYFTYLHSEHEVVVIPEFSTWTSMLPMVIVFTFAIAIYKRLLKNTNKKHRKELIFHK